MDATYYAVTCKAVKGIIRVLACSPWHAKQLAMQKHSDVEPNVNAYRVLPKAGK